MIDAFEYWYKAIVDEVVDGDTVRLTIDMGCRIFVKDLIRLYGINAPELPTIPGVLSKKFLQQCLPIGSNVTIQTHKNGKDKYGRWLGDIYIQSVPETISNGTNVCVNDLMLKHNHAVELNY
jgi:micrococcal nuclease